MQPALVRLCRKFRSRCSSKELKAVNRPSPTSTASEHAPPVAPSPSASSVKAVQASWAKAENIGLRVVGELFFKELFEASPAAKELFTAQKFGEDAAGQRRFKAHTLNVMQTLSAAVYGLSDLSALAPVLETLGEQHLGYGVLPEHYAAAGSALLATLRVGLGDDFTPSVETAWRDVYDFMSQVMQNGSSRAMYSF
mmetsp:Transcript_8154/g.26921  ORF Transcript_8154/g.26921 Transcript_8154/m.26921 type:complete len:196 (+) Transcript_8154:94-681(+)